jgi:hypothetical protein
MMSDKEKLNELSASEVAEKLSVLVQLENGAVIRIREGGKGALSIVVSQGFGHQKRFRATSSYANLLFTPDGELTRLSGGAVPLAARFLVSFNGVLECLISGSPAKRRQLRDLLGNDTSLSGKAIVWGNAGVSGIDLSTLIAVTPKKGVLTLEEAIDPADRLRKKEIQKEIARLFKGSGKSIRN